MGSIVPEKEEICSIYLLSLEYLYVGRWFARWLAGDRPGGRRVVGPVVGEWLAWWSTGGWIVKEL